MSIGGVMVVRGRTRRVTRTHVRCQPQTQQISTASRARVTCRLGDARQTLEMRNVTVLSDATNYVVVHSEGRRFPGLVVQGDRLNDWQRLVSGGDVDSIAILAEELAIAVEEYKRVCEARGQELPF